MFPVLCRPTARSHVSGHARSTPGTEGDGFLVADVGVTTTGLVKAATGETGDLYRGQAPSCLWSSNDEEPDNK